MSSVEWNLTRKLEWMGRRLRYIDAAGEIKEWVAAMSTINSLLKQVEIKRCSNNWMPWSKRNESVKIDFRTRDLGISDRTITCRILVW